MLFMDWSSDVCSSDLGPLLIWAWVDGLILHTLRPVDRHAVRIDELAGAHAIFDNAVNLVVGFHLVAGQIERGGQLRNRNIRGCLTHEGGKGGGRRTPALQTGDRAGVVAAHPHARCQISGKTKEPAVRSEEHTSELQSLMRHSSAVSCLKTKKQNTETLQPTQNTK